MSEARGKVAGRAGIWGVLASWVRGRHLSPQVPRHPTSIHTRLRHKTVMICSAYILTPFPCTGTGELPLAVFKVRPTVTHKNYQFRMIMPYYHIWDVMVTFYATMWQK